ncbi:MAG: CocE/NonD family hydrolase, partial [Actinomycetota bacterium]|nr:CocE/NonD family hydrolase [Actinomycetota bacterium]
MGSSLMAVVIEQNVDAKMRDGTVLRADIYRPSEEGNYPVLVQRTPYNKEFWPFTAAMLDPRKAASSGYVVVIQDVRGRWASDGDEFIPYVNEMDDGSDTVDWAAKLPWSDGNVGAYGMSYMGETAWHIAYARPEALKAISPWTAPHSWEDHMWRGGAFMLGLVVSYALGIGASVLPRKKIGRPEFIEEFIQLFDNVDNFRNVVTHLPINKMPALRPGDQEFIPFVFDWMSRLPGDEFNQQILKERLHTQVQVPALIVSGWHDVTIGHDLAHYAATRDAGANEDSRKFTKLIIGPWSHANVASFMPVVGDIDFGTRASGALLDLKEDLTALQLRWFNRWLKGERNGIDEEPPVKIFVQGLNRWRDESEWP